MGRTFVVELEGRSYRCKFCKTHLAIADDLISRAFHGMQGKAYLFNNVCAICSSSLFVDTGFRFVYSECLRESAHAKSQKYKEGKFILERGRIVDEIDFSTEFYIDTRANISDAEDA